MIRPYSIIDLGQPVNRLAPLNRGLVAWWKVLPQFYGTRFRDLAGGNHAAMVSMGAAISPLAQPNGFGSLQFSSGTDMYANAAQVTTGYTGITISLWFRTLTSQSAYLVSMPQASASVGPCIRITSTTVESVINTDVSATSPSVSTTPHDGIWHHVITRWSANSVTVSLNYDGGSPVVSGLSGTQVKADYNEVSIGQFNGTGFDLGRYTGNLDDVRIYNRELSDSEALALYSAGRTGYRNELSRSSQPVGVKKPSATFKAAWARRSNQVIGVTGAA